MKKVFYVYKITCLCGEWKDKFYIGSHYGYTDDDYAGSGKLIKKYFNLYGKTETYTKEILEICKNREDAYKRESYYINCVFSDLLNINKNKGTSIGNYGKHHSRSTKNKISKSLLGHPATKGFKGRKHSELSKQKIKNNSKGTTGYKWINDGKNRKYVKIEFLDEYLENGWVQGYKNCI